MNQSTPHTPNEALAECITAHLIDAGLILPAKAEEVRMKVAAGKARIEDWQRWIEQAIEQKARNSKEAAHGQA